MKNIKKVDILGETYKVIQAKSFKEHGLLGLCDNEHHTIHIYPEQNKDSYIKTLLHEVIHGISHQSGLSQSLPNEVEEMICEMIPNVLCKNFDIVPKKHPKKHKKKTVKRKKK